MSNAVTALNGATWNDGIATVEDIGLQGMITLRGDLADTGLKNAATGVAAVDFPGQGQANCEESRGICWMSPDEVLVLCPYEAVAANLEKINTTLSGKHALAVDVSDARAVFRVSGLHAREVMAKLVPVDLSAASFKPGMFRRTRLAQAPAAFWLHDAEMFQIVCFRSHAQYVFDVLKVAAQAGSEVGSLH